MPLTYDDIPGSWGAYSENWPEIEYCTNIKDKVILFCRDNIKYGSYVYIAPNYKPIRLDGSRQQASSEHRIRLETKEQYNLVKDFISSLKVNQ